MTRKTTAEDKAIGQRIKSARLAKGWSLETLGAKVGMTFQGVQKYENGLNAIRASRLQHFATALEVPLLQLYGWPTLPPGAAPTSVASAEAIEISHRLDFLEVGDRERALAVIEAVLRAYGGRT